MRLSIVRLLTFFGLAAVGFATLSHAGPITLAPGTLVLPGVTLTLTPGETFRLVFVTSQTYTATSPDISTYNADVLASANSNSDLAALDQLGLAWEAIASTSSNDAFDNIGGSFTAPIIDLDGTLIASGSSGLWAGYFSDFSISVTEDGSQLATYVWTGSTPFGHARTPYPLGGDEDTFAKNTSEYGWDEVVGGGWTAYDIAGTSQLESLYAISDLITVGSEEPPAGVPEPGHLHRFAGALLRGGRLGL